MREHEVVRYQSFQRLVGKDLQCSCGARFYLAPTRSAYRGSVERVATHFAWPDPPKNVSIEALEAWVATQTAATWRVKRGPDRTVV